jgi:hypothetical protein
MVGLKLIAHPSLEHAVTIRPDPFLCQRLTVMYIYTIINDENIYVYLLKIENFGVTITTFVRGFALDPDHCQIQLMVKQLSC